MADPLSATLKAARVGQKVAGNALEIAAIASVDQADEEYPEFRDDLLVVIRTAFRSKHTAIADVLAAAHALVVWNQTVDQAYQDQVKG